MGHALSRLEPRRLWDLFAALAEIPRPSKHEERVVEWVRSLAVEHGFDVSSDAVGNLVLRVPSSSGRSATSSSRSTARSLSRFTRRPSPEGAAPPGDTPRRWR